ncbi:MAG: AsmA-like C-terminal region-containing protein, partial [Bacteroidia bacterium]|nr:AsmA-like C-terminal region-containing protein [Bacteroidia bacterium]
ELLWDFDHPAHSQLKLSQFYLIGGDYDTLSAEGKYLFAAQKGRFHLNGSIQLENLAQVELYDSLQGHISADLQFSFTPNGWEAEGKGEIQDFHYKGLTIKETHAQINKDALTFTHLSGSYDNLSFSSPYLHLSPLNALTDSSSSSFYIQGKLHLPNLNYAQIMTASDNSSTGSAPLNLIAEVELRIDTLFYSERQYGPLTAQVVYKPDTFAIPSLSMSQFAEGSIELSFMKTTHFIHLYSRFQNLNLHTLSQEVPELDTLFPLLPHLRGRASGESELHLPLSQGLPRWMQAEGNLKLLLRDFVVVESPYTYELFSLVPITDFKRIQVGSVQAEVRLAEGVMRLDTTWLQANQWRMRVAGSHTLRGELAYDLWVEVPRMLLEKSQQRVQEWVEEQNADLWKLAIKVSGTTSQPKFGWKAVAPRLSKPSGMLPRRKSKKPKSSLPVEEN